jgi:hypothetical protein
MRPTTKRLMSVVMVPIAVGTLWGQVAAQGFVYPAKGQSPEQQQQDQQQCSGWAMQASGANPGAAPPPPSSPGMGRTAARGAAVGAVGGAIGGNAGKGAAIGAATGALVGGVRRADERRAADAQQAATSDAFNRAFAACMESRGYTVK